MEKELTLTNGMIVLIDEQDYEILSRFRWSVHKEGYVIASIPLHRLVMEAEKGQIVDHINGDKLDNRKTNLRVCSGSDNAKNRKAGIRKVNKHLKYKGIKQSGGKFFAQICSNRDYYRSPLFETQEEAAKAYNDLAIKHHGDFARINTIN